MNRTWTCDCEFAGSCCNDLVPFYPTRYRYMYYPPSLKCLTMVLHSALAAAELHCAPLLMSEVARFMRRLAALATFL
jgi:hypothetical protein